MQKFTTLTAVAAPLPMLNVDTDMIIPKQFLKTIQRTGLGKHLFEEMRYTPDGKELPDFVLNKAAWRILGAVLLLLGLSTGALLWLKTAQRLVGDYEKVIIDTPGFRSQATLACLGVSDFVLVPVKPSPFDVDRMLDTLNILINGVSGRRPIFRCVLTQTTRESVIAKHIRSELAEAGFPVLDSEMTNRVVYAESALWGATPSLTDRSGPAARDIAAIADEVDSILGIKRAA